MLLGLAGVNTYAQEAITVNGASVPVTGIQTVNVTEFTGITYSALTAVFDTVAVNTALGTASITEATPYIVNVTDNSAVENTTDGWRNGAGDLCGWGDITAETKGYCVKISAPETGLIDYLGAHHNGVWATGEQFTGIWGFVANDKAALVKVVVDFVDKPTAPHVEYTNEIQVQSTVECSSTRGSMEGSKIDTVTVNVGDLKTILGVEEDELLTDSWFYLLVCGDTYNADMGMATGGVSVLFDNDGWVHQVQDPDTQKLSAECASSSDNTGNAFRVGEFTYDAEAGTVTFCVSHKAGTNLSEEMLFTNIYLLYNEKAVLIKYTMNIQVSEIQGLEDMTSVGSTDIVAELPPSSTYKTTGVHFDLEAVATALGCASGDITFKALQSANTFYEGAATEGSGGWFLSPEGYVTNWRDASTGAPWYITEVSTGSFSVGQDGGFYAATVGESFKTTIYATFNEKYYAINITLNIIENNVGDWTSWKSVGTRVVKVLQLKDAAQYVWSDPALALSYTDASNLLGTESPILYGNATDAEKEAAGGCPFTNSYTITEEPGFWMDANAVNVGWGNGSVWGVSTSVNTLPDGIALSCMWMTTTPIETPYTGSLYLLNPNNGKYVTLNVIYQLVDNITEFEVVGTTDLVLPVSADEWESEYDLTEIATAIGYASVDELAEAYTLRGVTSGGTYSEAVTPSTGLTLDNTGAVTDDGQMGVYFESGSVFTWANEDPADDWTTSTQFIFENTDAGKQYVVNVTLMTASAYEEYVTAVDGIKADTKKGRIYDLSGRQVTKMQKGVYIKDGKKILK